MAIQHSINKIRNLMRTTKALNNAHKVKTFSNSPTLKMNAQSEINHTLEIKRAISSCNNKCIKIRRAWRKGAKEWKKARRNLRLWISILIRTILLRTRRGSSRILNPISSLGRTVEFRAFLHWLWITSIRTTANLASVKLMLIIKRLLEMKNQDILVSSFKSQFRKINTATTIWGSITITNSSFQIEINMPMWNRISIHLELLFWSSSRVYMLLQKSRWSPCLEQINARGKRLEVQLETL